MIRIAVCGAGGRMGRALVAAIHATEGAVLSGAVERPESTLLGANAGELAGVGHLGLALTGSLADVIAQTDVVIDFTAPAATIVNIGICRDAGKAIVIGTTGLDAGQRAELTAAAAAMPLVYSGNYSVGVNVTLQLLELAARAFGETVDIDVLEAHHRHKVDAPSGTALMMGEAVAKRWGVISTRSPAMPAKAIPARASVARSASRPCVAVTPWVITRCSSLARASVSKCAMSPPTAPISPRARCVPRAGWRRVRPASTTCVTCSDSAERIAVRRPAGLDFVAPPAYNHRSNRACAPSASSDT